MTRFSTFIFGFFCLFDILGLLPFAIPGLNEVHISQMTAVNEALGGSTLVPFEPVHLLVAAMLGIVGTGWSVWRWFARSPSLVIYEGALRACFAAWFLGVGVIEGLPVVVAFGVVDTIAAILHFVAGRQVLRRD